MPVLCRPQMETILIVLTGTVFENWSFKLIILYLSEMLQILGLTSHSSFFIYVHFLQITYSRDALQSIAPTATQLVKNFQSVNAVYITPHPPLVPIYMCSAYGTASVAPIDTLMLTILPPTSEHADSVCGVHSTYGVVGSTTSSSDTSFVSTELTTLQDFITHTSNVMMGINKDATDSSTELQTVCRVWGLYTESPSIVSDTSYVPCLQHTTCTVWRLLTVDSTDFAIALSALFDDTVRSSANNKARTYVEQRKCLALMVEYTTTPYVLHNAADVATSPITEPDIAASTEPDTAVYSVWPTDHILHAQGHTRQPLQDTASAMKKECPFSIAEHVDVLNNNNQWCVGIVTNIARDHVPTNTDPHNVNVSITVRPLVDSDGRAVATKVPKLSGPGIRQTTEEVRNAPSDPATDITPVVDNVDKIYSQARKADGGDDSGEEEGSGEDEEGSDEGSVESAIVNRTNLTPVTTAKATASAPINSGSKASNGGEESGSEEGSSSDEEESADDNSLIRDKRSTTTAKPATNNNNPANNATTSNNDTATAGVTWPSAPGSNVIVVSYNSLRILDLGTMTSPTITYTNNNNNRATSFEEAYLPKLMHNLHTVSRQHVIQQTTLSAAAIDKAVATKSTTSSNVSRQPSAVPSHVTSSNITPVKAASSSNIIISPKQDSNSSFTGSKGLLFNSPGKNSVVPHTPEVFTEQEVHTHTKDNQGAAVLASNAHLSSVLTVSEWDKLQNCMCNVNTCAFPLRALYILLLTECLILLPPKHPYKGTVCIASGLYDANRYLYIAPSVAPEMLGVMNSADDNHSTTSYSSSNAPHYKNHPRDPISKFFKGCGKSIQRSFAPKETEVLGQTDLLNHLNSNASTSSNNITTNNTSNGHSHGDGNNTTEPEPHNKAFKDGQIGPMNVRSNSSSTINTQNNNNTNFPHQKPATVAATIAKPQVTTSVNNIGIRIVGVAGMCAFVCFADGTVKKSSSCIIFYVCIFP